MPSIRSLASASGIVFLTCFVQQSLADTNDTSSSGPTTYPSCPDISETCTSHGVDFHDGGSYFQNVNSTDDFTFASKFFDCQTADATNILVDPTGNEYICSSTTLTPDNTTVTSTCPIEKDALVSGDWSVLISSNNGGCAPIAYKRDFILSVGLQQTTTITPIVIFTSTSTPITTSTTTSTDTTTYYLPTSTKTTAKSAKNPTRTVTPGAVISTVTTTLQTKTLTRYDLEVINKVRTSTARCTLSSLQATADPTATATVDGMTSSAVLSSSSSLATSSTTFASSSTVLASSVAMSSSAVPTSYARRSLLESLVGDKFAFMNARAARLDHAALHKRAPDVATITEIQTSVSSFVTLVSTITASAVTTTSTSIVDVQTTVTPVPITLYVNQRTTITLATPTKTKTRTIKMAMTWITNTKYVSAVITTTVTPAAAAAKCTSSGGFMS